MKCPSCGSHRVNVKFDKFKSISYTCADCLFKWTSDIPKKKLEEKVKSEESEND